MLMGNPMCLSRRSAAPCRVVNCRPDVRALVSSPPARGSSASASTAVSITVTAAASALLAKVAALLAAGVSPGALPTALKPSSVAFKGSEKEYHTSTPFMGPLSNVVAQASASSPVSQPASSAVALPADWLIVSSASEWFNQHRQASAADALLATVFISDKAALAHAPLLERLRRNFGSGADAPVRFVFVHIGADYQQRHLAASTAASTAALARGAGTLTLGRISHTAALHGLDVALTSFLPDGVRAFPSLLLTAGPAEPPPPGVLSSVDGAAAAAPWSWSAATRVGELTQLVSDWAFISDLRRRRNTLQQQPQPECAEAVDAEERASLLEAIAADPRGPGKAAHTATVAPAAPGSRRKGDAAAVLVTV